MRLQAYCHNVCNQLPSLSPDESMTLPGSFLSALLCSSKWALQCTPTLVWGFSVKPNWCTVHSDWCLRLILSTNKLEPISGSECVFVCGQKRNCPDKNTLNFWYNQHEIKPQCMAPWVEHRSWQSALALFVRVEKPLALPVFKATDHTHSLHFKKLTENAGNYQRKPHMSVAPGNLAAGWTSRSEGISI